MIRALVEQRINSISYPPSQEEALLYGHGFGDSFEVDYASVERVILTELRARFALSPPGLPPSPAISSQPASRHTSAVTTAAALDATPVQPNSVALSPTPSVPPRNRISTVSARRSVPFSAKELFQIAQAAVSVRWFDCKHGERGGKEREMCAILREAGVPGSIKQFKDRLAEIMIWQAVSHSDSSCRIALTSVIAP